ncbi:hypothetical protein DRO02_02020 [archaeon]|nr:MAG: hypothetical protein DRO21_03240 [archaeon]RLG65456.1 MAG: hypothetical protein DRO02_02020 [archaeon]HDM24024.1 hypothetical protein [Candidatus Bathyarchaeota archaeon]
MKRYLKKIEKRILSERTYANLASSLDTYMYQLYRNILIEKFIAQMSFINLIFVLTPDIIFSIYAEEEGSNLKVNITAHSSLQYLMKMMISFSIAFSGVIIWLIVSYVASPEISRNYSFASMIYMLIAVPIGIVLMALLSRKKRKEEISLRKSLLEICDRTASQISL